MHLSVILYVTTTLDCNQTRARPNITLCTLQLGLVLDAHELSPTHTHQPHPTSNDTSSTAPSPWDQDYNEEQETAKAEQDRAESLSRAMGVGQEHTSGFLGRVVQSLIRKVSKGSEKGSESELEEDQVQGLSTNDSNDGFVVVDEVSGECKTWPA